MNSSPVSGSSKLARSFAFCFGFMLVALLTTLQPVYAMTLDIVVNKVSQKMTVSVNGDKEYVWPVSTGARGYDTPTGTFRPFRLEKEHFSKEWDDAPMPHSIFFTGAGHAIHGSYHVKSLGRRASHGCVRLAPENATKLFALVQKAGLKNTRITIKGGLFDGAFSDAGSNKSKRSLLFFQQD